MRKGNERPTKYKNPREGYTFDFKTKQEVLEDDHFRCEYCGELLRLEAHHIIAIWFAREVGIPPEIITSPKNLAYADHSCHTRIHQSESRYVYAQIAWHLFGIDVEVDSSKDDWRKDPSHPSNRKQPYDDTRTSQ